MTHACTDITGFGLIGHASEMAIASGTTLVVELDAVPVFDGVAQIAAVNKSGGMNSNREHFADAVRMKQFAAAGGSSGSVDPKRSRFCTTLKPRVDY